MRHRSLCCWLALQRGAPAGLAHSVRRCPFLPACTARLLPPASWIHRFLRADPAPEAQLRGGVDYATGRDIRRAVAVSEVLDIEEGIWSTKYGVKGMIDVRQGPAGDALAARLACWRRHGLLSVPACRPPVCPCCSAGRQSLLGDWAHSARLLPWSCPACSARLTLDDPAQQRPSGGCAGWVQQAAGQTGAGGAPAGRPGRELTVGPVEIKTGKMHESHKAQVGPAGWLPGDSCAVRTGSRRPAKRSSGLPWRQQAALAGSCSTAPAPTPLPGRSPRPMQVLLYLLLMEERYGRPLDWGMLWYTGQPGAGASRRRGRRHAGAARRCHARINPLA